VRALSSWLARPLVVVVTAGLLAAPLAFGIAPRGRGAVSPGTRPAAAQAVFPACSVFGTDGDDRIVGTAGADVICARAGDDVVRGAGGNDVMFGGSGGDRLYGGRGDDRVYGSDGDDELSGGRGDDFLQGAGGSDVIAGGAGTDTADYGLRRGAVRVTLGSGANDGAPGERDDVRADVERVNSGRGDDVLVGNARANALSGGGGRDMLEGRRGDDALRGDADADRLLGGRGDDRLWGGSGRDRLEDRDGAGFVDRLRCGRGRGDTALADGRDRVARDCERVRRRRPPRPRNHAPTGIGLSNRNVTENQPAGKTVGTLSAVDRDRRDRHTFTLVAGAGGADNGSFRINGSRLETNAAFDYETKSTYSVRVRATDRRGASFSKAFTITVTDLPERVNHAPTDIALSNSSVDENEPVGTTVGMLGATDPDGGDTHTFALVAGAGAADNGAFAIAGATLRTNAVFDYETKNTYSIRVRTADAAGATFDEQLTIAVRDRNDPPSAAAQAVTGVPENGAQTITLSGSDPEGEALSFHVAAPLHGQLDTTTPAATCDGQTPSHCTASVVYTPNANFNGPDSFAYTVNDGTSDSPAAVVAITVAPANDAPVATSTSLNGTEDAPLAVDLGTLVSDAETSDANLTYQIVTAPAHGQLTGSGPNPTYTPDPNYNGPDAFTYRVTDRGDPDNCGSPGAGCAAAQTSTTETVSIALDPVNDAPVAGNRSLSATEDGSAPIDLTTLVSDVETSAANLTYTIVSGPAHGQLTGAGASRTHTPDAGYNGPDSFTYTVTDRGDPDNCGSPGPSCAAAQVSATATVSITVDAVNDAPINTLPPGPITAVRDTDVPIVGVSVADDAGSEPVQVVLSVAHGALAVSTTVPFGVGPLEVTGNGSSSVTVTAPIAAINATFADPNGLVYHSDSAFTGLDTLTVATDDLGHTGAGGAKTDTDTLAITVSPPNAAPVAAGQTVSADEDTAKTITLSATDADGDDPLTFAIDTAPTHGSLGPIGTVTCSHATPNVCTVDVVYTPTADYNGLDSFAFTANDGQVDSAPATVSITVNPVNDAPRLENIEAGALAYTENDPATAITATTSVTDVDSPDFDTGTLTVDFAAGGTADDRLEIANQGTGAGQIGASGSNVTFGGTTIGTFAGGSGTTPLVVTFNASATTAAVQALVRAITYRNVSDAPATAARTVRFVLTDGDGGTSAPATRAISLTAVNDPPTLAAIEPAALAYTENDPTTAVTSTLTVTDPDSNITGATITIGTNLAPSEDVLSFVNQLGITGSYNAATGVLTLTGSTTPANYQTALPGVRQLLGARGSKNGRFAGQTPRGRWEA
jgi:Bacterial Ig domain/Cadherin domain/RTX calcium-binding nonapeptide repeat (4 copies)